MATGSPPVTLVFSLVVSDANASSSGSTVIVTVNPAGNTCLSGNPPPAPPGTPPPAPPNPNPPPTGGSGSHRFEMGTDLSTGLYVVDPLPGEARVVGFVVVSLDFGPAPADAVVTLNGVALTRLTPGNKFWKLDPAGAQPEVGSGGELVLVATATDPSTGKQVQRTLVLPCPSDIEVTSTPALGAALVPSPTGGVHLASPADISLNVGVQIMAPYPPLATLYGYEPCTQALVGYGAAHPIPPGPLNLDVPVCQSGTGSCTATTASGYLLDLRWPGHFIIDGQSGGYCGLAKRFFFTR